MVNGEEQKNKALVFKFGLMVQNMKDSGEIIKPPDEENLLMWMEIYMREIGYKIKQTDKENIFIATELHIKEAGKMIFSMVLVYKPG